MAIDFPNNPTTNQIFTTTEGSWQWDGTKWVAYTLFIPQGNANVFISDTAPASPDVGDLWYDSVGAQLYVWYSDANSTQWVVVVNQNSASLLLSGGTLTGPLILAADPTVPLGAATKEYVDATNIRYRNRIINGDMSLDQRNGGNAVAAVSNAYAIDRWRCTVSQAAQKGATQQIVVTTPGFPYHNALYWVTNTAAYAVAAGDYYFFGQSVEGCNFNDALWGTASAQPIVLEFWAQSSLAGIFGGSVRNAANNRSYVFTYTLAANVFTKVRITIPGDTTGTWSVAYNASALVLAFSLGVGTSLQTTSGSWQAGNFLATSGSVSVVGTLNSNFFVTGVALMVGAAAANAEPEFRKYADNLIDCCRYFFKGSYSFYTYAGQVNNYIGGVAYFPATQRAAGTYTMVSSANNAVTTPTFSAIADSSGVYVIAQSTAIGGCNMNFGYTADADF